MKRAVTLGVVVALGAAGATHAITSGNVRTRNSTVAAQTGVQDTAPVCVVPSLSGMPLGAARRALGGAGCALGKVTGLGDPSASLKEGSVYMVTGQSPSAGTTLAANGDVVVQLGPAPAGFVSYRVPSGSMEPSFSVGASLWVQTQGHTPAIGRVVVFHPPTTAEVELCGPAPHTVTPGRAACRRPVPKPATIRVIKRIVAGPGDLISVRDGHVIRNGKRESECLHAPLRSKPGVQLSDTDQDSARALVHGGRQPRRI